MDLNEAKEAFDLIVGRAKAAFKNGRYAKSAELLQEAANAAWHRHAGFFCSVEMETVLKHISTKTMEFRSEAKDRPPGPDRVLHVLTRAHSIGGHSRLAWRWIESDPVRSHSLVLTQQGAANAPHQLQTSVAAHGGKTFQFDDSKTLIEKARMLREIASGFDYIILHVHPFDVTPHIAWSGGNDHPPIGHLNHADHVFWLGSLVSDLSINIRSSGHQLSLRRRGIPEARNALLPIPIVNERKKGLKTTAKVRLDIPDDHQLAITIASPHKFVPINGMDYLKLHAPLLDRCERLRFIVVGPDPKQDYWKNCSDLTNGRIRAVGISPATDIFLDAADVYVDSTPIGSLTSLLEAGLAGIPCCSWRPFGFKSSEAVLSCNDPALDALPVAFNDHAEYIQRIEDYLRNGELAAEIGRSLQHSIIEKHTGSNWRQDLENVYRNLQFQRTSRPHEISLQNLGATEAFDAILLRTQGGFTDRPLSPPPIFHVRKGISGRLKKSVKKRWPKHLTKVRIHRSIGKRIIRLTNLTNQSRLPFDVRAPVWLRLALAENLLRTAELHNRKENSDGAYELLSRCPPKSLVVLPPAVFDNVLDCLAANRAQTQIRGIASEIMQRSPVLAPLPTGLTVASACLGAQLSDRAHALFEGWRNISTPLANGRFLSGVLGVRTLFPEHLARSEEAGLCVFKRPSIMGKSDGRSVTLPLPYDRCAVVENALLAGTDPIVDSENNLVVYDLAAHPRYPHVAGHEGLIKGSQIRPDLAAMHYHYDRLMHMTEAIHVAARSSGNYFHWLVEYLPRLLNALEGGAHRDAPLLIPVGLPKTMIRALEIVNDGEFPVCTIPQNAAVQVDKLYVPSMHSFIVDGLGLPLSQIGALSARHLQFLRNKVLHNIARSGNANELPRKIYLSRGKRGRALSNERDIENALHRIGFQSVDPVTMSFEEQVRLFRDAEVIIGPSSAALANIIFCERDPIVLSLIAAHNADFGIYANLLQVVGNGRFSHVLGRPKISPSAARNNHEYMHVDFTVKASDVIESLRLMEDASCC
jgi:glycosyltransferase involved in cell wall biosynthesis